MEGTVVTALMKYVESCPICNSTAKAVVYPARSTRRSGDRRAPGPLRRSLLDQLLPGLRLLLSNPVLNDARVKQLYEQAETTNVIEGEEENVRRTMAGYYQLVRLICRPKEDAGRRL